MPYDARCEVFLFVIVLLELLSGHLQGAEVSGASLFLEDECSGIAPDARAGEWPVALVEQWRELAADCTKRYTSRVRTMSTVLRD
jgi:hypothetical protein